MKTYIGIDNGISGSIAILGNEAQFIKTPIKKELSYTKKKQHISRIDFVKFLDVFTGLNPLNCIVLLERPMVNPTRFKASVSGLRAFEATLIAIEILGFPLQYEDSKKWQGVMLPKGLKGDELKEASLNVGNRLFPQFANIKHPDRDSLLMAEYAKRAQL